MSRLDWSWSMSRDTKLIAVSINGAVAIGQVWPKPVGVARLALDMGVTAFPRGAAVRIGTVHAGDHHVGPVDRVGPAADLDGAEHRWQAAAPSPTSPTQRQGRRLSIR